FIPSDPDSILFIPSNPPIFCPMNVKRPVLSDAQIRVALRDSEQRLQSVVNSASMVLWAIDRDGTFTFSAGKSLELLGLDPGEVVGRSVFELYTDVPQVLDDI